MNELFYNIKVKYMLLITGLLHLLITHGVNVVMAVEEESKSSEIMCSQYKPTQLWKNCYAMNFTAIEIDTILEVKSTQSSPFDLCGIFTHNESSYFFQGADKYICAIRQRPDIIFNHTSESVIPKSEKGWRFINRNLPNCDEDHLGSLPNKTYSIYYCHDSNMFNYGSQNEIAVDEDTEMEVHSMKKIYISNLPAVAEAYESKRNSIWHRLENDHSLFSEAKRHYCHITMYNQTSVIFTGSGALFESTKAMENDESRKNFLTLKNNSSELWTYNQNIMNNSHMQYQCNSDNETYLFQYSSKSVENEVVFAVPVRVVKGTMKVKCGFVTYAANAIISTTPAAGDNIILDSQPSSKKDSKGLLVGAIVGAILAMLVITVVLVIFLKYRKRRGRRKLEISNVSLSFREALRHPAEQNIMTDMTQGASTGCDNLHQNSPTTSPLLNQTNPFSRQYTFVNGFRRKISTYSSRDENIYCDLDDFHLENEQNGDSIGGAGNDNFKRRSAMVMINNGMYEINNDQKCILVENGKRFAQKTHRAKDSASSDSERDSVNASKRVGYYKRTSVVEMVDNEMYCSSDEDECSARLSNPSESDSLNEQLCIKRVPESVNRNDKMAPSSSVKLPARRCLSKVEEQSETSSSSASDSENSSIWDRNTADADTCDNENPYLVSSRKVPMENKTSKKNSRGSCDTENPYLVSNKNNTDSCDTENPYLVSNKNNIDSCDKENPYLVSSRHILKDHNTNSKSIDFNMDMPHSFFTRDNQNIFNGKDGRESFFKYSSIPSEASCQSLSSADDTLDNDFDEIDGKIPISSSKTDDPYEVPNTLIRNKSNNCASLGNSKHIVKNETKNILPVKIITCSSGSESDDSQSSSSSNKQRSSSSKLDNGKNKHNLYETPKTLTNKKTHQYDADNSSSASSNEEEQTLLSSFKHKRRRKSRTKQEKGLGKVDDIKLPVAVSQSNSSDNNDELVSTAKEESSKSSKIKNNKQRMDPYEMPSQTNTKTLLTDNLYKPNPIVDPELNDLYKKPYRHSTKIPTKLEQKDSVIKLPITVNSTSSESESVKSSLADSSSRTCDTANPYEVSCDKRPSIVKMIDNDIYTSDSSDVSDDVQYIQSDEKRPSVTVMVQNEAHVPSSDENDPNVKQVPPVGQIPQRDNSNEKRKSVSVKSDNYINTNLRDNKGRKVRYKRDYEIIDEVITSSEDELVVTKL